MPKQPHANLLVVERREGPVYYAKWRAHGAQVKRRLGPAWIEHGDAAKAERRRTRHDGWIKRRGRVVEGYLSEDEAIALIPALVAEHQAEQARALSRIFARDMPSALSLEQGVGVAAHSGA